MSLSNSGTKILAIFVILIAGCLGSAFPSLGKYFASRSNTLNPSTQRIIAKFLTSMSAGIVVTTGLLHVGADAVTLTQESGGIFADPTFPYLPGGGGAMSSKDNNETVSPIHEEHDHPYPYVALIIVFTVFVSYFLSTEISAWGMNQMKALKKLKMKSASVKKEKKSENTDEPKQQQQQQQQQREGDDNDNDDDEVEVSPQDHDRLAHRIQLNQIIAGVAVHSFILGITLGIAREQSSSRVLMLVLMLDCMFDGLAVGNLIMAAEISFLISTIYVLIFALMAPIGIAVGMSIENPDLRAQGVMSAVSAGLLLHMAFELFNQVFEHHHHHNQKDDDENEQQREQQQKAPRRNSESGSVSSDLVPNTSSSSSNIDNNMNEPTQVVEVMEVEEDEEQQQQANEDDSDYDFMETFAFRIICYFFVCAGGALQMAIRVWE